MTALEFFKRVKDKNYSISVYNEIFYFRSKIEMFDVKVKGYLYVFLENHVSFTVESDVPITEYDYAYYIKGLKVRVQDDLGGTRNDL